MKRKRPQEEEEEKKEDIPYQLSRTMAPYARSLLLDGLPSLPNVLVEHVLEYLLPMFGLYDLLDVRSSENECVWLPAIVVGETMDIRGLTHITVTYVGFDKDRDNQISTDADRLAPFLSRSSPASTCKNGDCWSHGLHASSDRYGIILSEEVHSLRCMYGIPRAIGRRILNKVFSAENIRTDKKCLSTKGVDGKGIQPSDDM